MHVCQNMSNQKITPENGLTDKHCPDQHLKPITAENWRAWPKIGLSHALHWSYNRAQIMYL